MPRIREHTGQNFKPTDTSAAKKTFTSDFDFEQSNKLLTQGRLVLFPLGVFLQNCLTDMVSVNRAKSHTRSHH